ncbi:PilW family protein [Acinetobacter johnsonii]|jgi:type IV pilus assembly protein PilW|uniref:PilW family protein n=1 Tax=Acinetobacter johnsonii TaxID=40214 RepID=UPI003AF525EE
MKSQEGFTLVELMIALALGLIVVAAATLLFLTGLRSSSMQQGVSDLQDNANFGLNYITQDIRLANLNNIAARVDDKLLLGGIVLSEDNFPDSLIPVPDPDNPNSSTFDISQLSSAGTGVSNVNQASDQLVIQYQPMAAGGFDCEGRIIADVDRIIVQRYFLREDDNSSTGERNPLALACDAGHYILGDEEINNFGDAGEIIMKRVDHFRVLLNVSSATGLRYMAIDDYMMETTPRPRVLGVSLGVLARSSQNVGQDQAISQNNQFTVLDQTVGIDDSGNQQGYLRRVVTQDVALRNALGEREGESESE